jgi:hypothetical protein
MLNRQYYEIKTDIEERYRKKRDYKSTYNSEEEREIRDRGIESLNLNSTTKDIESTIKTIDKFSKKLKDEKFTPERKSEIEKRINDLKIKIIGWNDKLTPKE